MYRLYKSQVLTDSYTYTLYVVEESRNEAVNKSIDYVNEKYKNEKMIGGGSIETDEIFAEKSIKLIDKRKTVL